MPSIPNTTCFGVASKGEIQWALGQQAKWKMALGRLDGKEIDLVVGPHQKKASAKQRKYYWAVIVAMIAEAAGYSPEEAHEALKWELLRDHTEGPLPTVKSTEDLTTAEREEFHSRCRMLGSQMFSIYIPEPNEAGY